MKFGNEVALVEEVLDFLYAQTRRITALQLYFGFALGYLYGYMLPLLFFIDIAIVTVNAKEKYN